MAAWTKLLLLLLFFIIITSHSLLNLKLGLELETEFEAMQKYLTPTLAYNLGTTGSGDKSTLWLLQLSKCTNQKSVQLITHMQEHVHDVSNWLVLRAILRVNISLSILQSRLVLGPISILRQQLHKCSQNP